MPGTLPTMFYTDIRYRTLAITFNVSVSIFGGTTPLVATWLVHATGNHLAPAFYLTIVSIIGFFVILFLFANTAGKSLKGSYPTVASKSEYNEAVENQKIHYGGTRSKQKNKVNNTQLLHSLLRKIGHSKEPSLCIELQRRLFYRSMIYSISCICYLRFRMLRLN